MAATHAAHLQTDVGEMKETATETQIVMEDISAGRTTVLPGEDSMEVTTAACLRVRYFICNI